MTSTSSDATAAQHNARLRRHLTVCALAALCAISLSAQTPQQIEYRRRYDEWMAQQYRLVDQADAAWDREMAREKAGDCFGPRSTREINECFVKAVEQTEVNYKAYSGALRAVLALAAPDFDGPNSGLTGTPPTPEEAVNRQVVANRSLWQSVDPSLPPTPPPIGWRWLATSY